MAKKRVLLMFGKKKKEELPYRVLKTSELLRRYLISKLPQQKNPVEEFTRQLERLPIPDADINHLAIVLDGVVEDVMRAQNRLAALLLSNPEFIEFHAQHENVIIGKTKYKDGKFVNDHES